MGAACQGRRGRWFRRGGARFGRSRGSRVGGCGSWILGVPGGPGGGGVSCSSEAGGPRGSRIPFLRLILSGRSENFSRGMYV